MSTFTHAQREDLKSLFRELSQEFNRNQDEHIVNRVLDHIGSQPSLKSAGYVSDYGGSADPSHKSFGDFLLAVQRNDQRRLSSIYKTRKDYEALKDVQLMDGPSGGYLVPPSYIPTLFDASADLAVVRPRANVFPVKTASGKVPSLNIVTAPSAGSGDTAFAGGMTLEWTAAGGTLTESEPTFEQVEFVIRKLAGYTEVENEVSADSPAFLDALLSRIFGRAVASMEDHAFLRGDGVAEPLGILNASCAVAVTPGAAGTFAWVDALNMRSRFRKMGGQPVWIIHPGIWPDIGVFESSAGGGVWQANMEAALNQTLLGYQILESEHMPQDDEAGCVLLADLSAYAIFDRQVMSIAFSEHAAFTTDKGTWRVVHRCDGQPWLSSTITLADPQGSYTVSPFAYFND